MGIEQVTERPRIVGQGGEWACVSFKPKFVIGFGPTPHAAYRGWARYLRKPFAKHNLWFI